MSLLVLDLVIWSIFDNSARYKVRYNIQNDLFHHNIPAIKIATYPLSLLSPPGVRSRAHFALRLSNVVVKYNIIPLNDIHHKTIYNVTSESPNNVRTASEEWCVMFLINPSGESDA